MQCFSFLLVLWERFVLSPEMTDGPAAGIWYSSDTKPQQDDKLTLNIQNGVWISCTYCT
jgi:hypothetical protein